MKTRKQIAKLQLIEDYFVQFLQCLKRLRKKKFTMYVHKYKLQDKNDYPVRNPTCGIYVFTKSAVAFTTFPTFNSFFEGRKGV